MLSNEIKTEHVKKAILSCKTNEQLDICKNWIKTIRFSSNNSIWEAYSCKLELDLVCLEMKKYLETLEVSK